MKMAFSDASLLSKIGLGISFAGLLFVVVGFSTNYWVAAEISAQVSSNSGLFKQCQTTSGVTLCVNLPSTILSDWFIATGAMVILGFLLGLGCLAVLIIYVLVKNDLKMLQLVSLALAFAAAFFVMIGIIIYGAKTNELSFGLAKLSWSFALTTAGGIIFIIDGIVLTVDKTKLG